MFFFSNSTVRAAGLRSDAIDRAWFEERIILE